MQEQRDYDWRKGEAALNRFAQFTTPIDGLDIHFIHVRSPHANAMPLNRTRFPWHGKEGEEAGDGAGRRTWAE